jgi:hypothetical protein
MAQGSKDRLAELSDEEEEQRNHCDPVAATRMNLAVVERNKNPEVSEFVP